MIDNALKSKIDKLWEEFWTGGVANPLTVIEQITYLIYARMLDIAETLDERKMARANIAFTPRFDAEHQHIRWSKLIHIGDSDKKFKLVRDELFPYFATIHNDDSIADASTSDMSSFMKDAQLMIQKPSLLVKAMQMVDELPLDKSGDVKGDLYEYLLSKLTTAGINGQFRTPRHIINALVSITNPSATDKVCDPACGTAGFLVSAYEHILQRYSDELGTVPQTDEAGEPIEPIYTGNLLTPEQRAHVNSDMFYGFDFDATMLRIAAMNLTMHGVTAPDIHYQDTLSQSFADNYPKLASDGFDVILANPPFKGSLDAADVSDDLLGMVSTKKTELLFCTLILRMLNIGGRAAVVVPDGVLFGSSKAHVQLRKALVEDNQLEAIISLPSGVFKPYAGVSTAVLVFTKGGATENVWFYDVTADGYSLDDKRSPIKDNDLPDLLSQWQTYKDLVEANKGEQVKQGFGDRTQQAFIVSKENLITNKYDLSINRYKEVVYEEENYRAPTEILNELLTLESEISAELTALKGLL